MGIRNLHRFDLTLKESYGVSTVPDFFARQNKQIIWQHRGYVEGDEYELFDDIKL